MLKAQDKKAFAFMMDMGTGKSITSILKVLKENSFPVLIITYNTIVPVWIDELAKMSETSVTVLAGPSVNKIKALKSTDSRFYVTNYEAVRLIKKDLLKKKFKAIILDESSAVKNPKAKQTKAILSLKDTAEVRIILSGTPANNPMDLWAQYYFLDPKILVYENFFVFRSHYAVTEPRTISFIGRDGQRRTRQFQEVTGYRNMEELTKRIDPYTFFIRKEDCFDLPPKTYTKRYVPLTEEQEKLYTVLEKELVAELTPGRIVVAKSALVKILRLQQIVNGYAWSSPSYDLFAFPKDEEEKEQGYNDSYYHDVPNNRIKVLLETVNEIGDASFVVWCRFIKDIKLVSEALTNAGVSNRQIMGAAEVEERFRICKEELNKGKIRAVVAQGGNRTCSYGIDMTGANYAIYYSNQWSPMARRQSEDRIYRHGQTRNVTVIDLVSPNTVDEMILASLTEGKQFQDKLSSDGWKMYKKPEREEVEEDVESKSDV